MNTVTTNTIILAVVLIVIAVAAVGWAFTQRQRRSQRLQRRFGPEYGRTVQELGGQTKAEAELKKREDRVARLKITTLSTADAARFAEAWNSLQGRFIDNPKGVVGEADRLVREVMVKRGYPMGDFERRAADISVDHPDVVATYRSAQVIAARDARGEADTEELRRAVVYYRTLFDELLEVSPARPVDARETRTPVHS
ncbi:MAG TPA: hypothetical protein VGN30_01430 [Steroidobacteraceae bacterium]